MSWAVCPRRWPAPSSSCSCSARPATFPPRHPAWSSISSSSPISSCSISARQLPQVISNGSRVSPSSPQAPRPSFASRERRIGGDTPGSFCSFCPFNGLMTAIGRLGLGSETASSSRYQSVTAISLIAAITLVLAALPNGRVSRRAGLGARCGHRRTDRGRGRACRQPRLRPQECLRRDGAKRSPKSRCAKASRASIISRW